ncbi:hypothetical protein Pfo_017343 [Paulownia fortunei]|nr:hypothetical protein Pfo_017343 [Paulownia fortunei]
MVYKYHNIRLISNVCRFDIHIIQGFCKEAAAERRRSSGCRWRLRSVSTLGLKRRTTLSKILERTIILSKSRALALRSAKKPQVVAGCVPQGSRDLKELEGLSIVGVQQIDRVVEVVEETLKGHEMQLLTRKTLPALDLPKVLALIESMLVVI